MTKKINNTISIVIPAFNEEKSIKPLYSKLKKAVDAIGLHYEIIIIDDGSSDNTAKVIQALRKRDKTVKAIILRRNFGKAGALLAGFDKAKGGIIITMDADLQDDPAEIPRMLKHFCNGYDVVVGWRYRRRDGYFKRLVSIVWNYLVRMLTKISIHDNDCNFRIIKKSIVKELYIYSGLYRHIPSIAFSKGFRVGEVKINHKPRKYGKSKYGYSRLFTGFMDLLVIKYLIDYNNRPLHFFGLIGVILFTTGFITGIYLSWIRLVDKKLIGGRPLLLLAILLTILGVQFIAIGLIGEMITYTQQFREKGYKVKDYLL